MDLRYTAEEDAFRDEARQWLRANVPAEPLPSFDTAEGFALHREWEAKLSAARWSAVSWPVDYGGRGADYIHWLIFEEEYWAAGAPGRVNQNGIFLLGPTIMEVGTPEQQARFLPKIASSEEVWAQAWSEPDAGSDMAAIRSTARLTADGERWVLNGQKIWASRAVWADWCFGIFRSDPASERHRGLTFILCPLDAAGITVRPIAQLDGDTGFAEIFFDDVEVPVANTLGEVGKGWSVAMATAGFERGVSLRSPARFNVAVERLIELWRERADPTDTALRDAVADAWMRAEGYRLHTYMTVTHLLDGGTIGSESSLNKIFWSEMDVRTHELALQILGPEAERTTGPMQRWVDGYLFSLAGPIYAGTNEIQRNIIADRVLQLPEGPLMRFSFTDDQRAFAAGLREMLERELPASRVRAVGDDGSGHDPALWRRLADMGVLSMLVPEAAGGLGGDEVDLVLLMEELGRAGAPGPVLETAAVAAPALERTDVIATTRLDGSPYVAHAQVAALILTPDGVHQGFTATDVDGIDAGRRLFTIEGGTIEPVPGLDADLAFDRGALASAAFLVGLGLRLVDIAGDHARQRHQFGQPIGSFQAVKHLMADALLKLEFARPAVYRAAWSVAHNEPTRGRDVSMAKALAGDAAHQASRTAIQVHGAMGYTLECDVQLYTKKVWALIRAWGDTSFHRRRVADAVLGR